MLYIKINVKKDAVFFREATMIVALAQHVMIIVKNVLDPYQLNVLSVRVHIMVHKSMKILQLQHVMLLFVMIILQSHKKYVMMAYLMDLI
jgi:hypothetical protein